MDNCVTMAGHQVSYFHCKLHFMSSCIHVVSLFLFYNCCIYIRLWRLDHRTPRWRIWSQRRFASLESHFEAIFWDFIHGHSRQPRDFAEAVGFVSRSREEGVCLASDAFGWYFAPNYWGWYWAGELLEWCSSIMFLRTWYVSFYLLLLSYSSEPYVPILAESLSHRRGATWMVQPCWGGSSQEGWHQLIGFGWIWSWSSRQEHLRCSECFNFFVNFSECLNFFVNFSPLLRQELEGCSVGTIQQWTCWCDCSRSIISLEWFHHKILCH